MQNCTIVTGKLGLVNHGSLQIILNECGKWRLKGCTSNTIDGCTFCVIHFTVNFVIHQPQPLKQKTLIGYFQSKNILQFRWSQWCLMDGPQSS